MKRFIISMLALVLLVGIAGAVTYRSFYTVGRKTVVSTAAVRLVSGLNSIGNIAIANPTTTYAVFDLFQTTATPGTTRLPIRTITVPAGSDKEYTLDLTNVRDFSIAFSTTSGVTMTENPVYFEYKTQ